MYQMPRWLGSALCVYMCCRRGGAVCVNLSVEETLHMRIIVFCSIIHGWILISGKDDQYCSPKNTESQHHNL